MGMMTMVPAFADLTGMKAVVTGASSGIGRAIAFELARGGADIVVHYARSRQAADSLVIQLQQQGVAARAMQADLRVVDAEQVVEEAWNAFGAVDIWINNAGADLLVGEGAVLEYDEKLQLLWQVDVQGTVALSRTIVGKMKARGRGVILNIGWDQADRGMEGESAELFSIAKNAIMGFTRSLALNAAPEVRVNCIAPGWIKTAWGEQAREKWQQRVRRETPLRRWGEPEDIAKLARFLVSTDAAYITGQVINANGGAVR